MYVLPFASDVARARAAEPFIVMLAENGIEIRFVKDDVLNATSQRPTA